jgi:DNA polymerase-3 subunit epsilon
MGRCIGSNVDQHRDEIGNIARALNGDPAGLFDRIEERMHSLAGQERYEEAADLRARAETLAGALASHAEMQALVRASGVLVAIGDRALLIENGKLAWAGSTEDAPPLAPKACPGYLDADTKREASLVSSWLRRTRESVRLLRVDAPWLRPIGSRPIARFAIKEPVKR